MKTTETTAPAVTGFIPTGLKTHATIIDGVTYETTTFTATRALVMLPKIVNLLGEDGLTLFLASNDDDAKGLVEEAQVEAALMSKVMENAVGEEGDADGLLVVKDLVGGTISNRIKIGDNFVTAKIGAHFDEYFAGNLTHLMAVSMWVFRCSFGEP